MRLHEFSTLDAQTLERIRAWRNHPDIRRWMLNRHEISAEEHLRFVSSLPAREDRRYFLVEKDGEYIGVIDFNDITADSAELGIYASPELRGMGTPLMEAIIAYATGTLKIRSLIASVFTGNDRAKHLYEKFDFKEIGRKPADERELIVMERLL
ncbi:MAG: UDP-4-amino-4,6-dideoxy-N-acetyl-beta-L-altrosamine N-acetyltransferase [Sulfuricurvum sp.]